MLYRNLLLILFILPLLLSSQESGEVIYSVVVKENDTIPKSDLKWQSSVQLFADTVNFKLLYTSEIAYFEVIQDKNYENVIQFFQEKHPRIKYATYQPESYFYYVGPTWQLANFNYRYHTKRMFVDDCIVKKEMETKWTITNEEMEILGYTCKKAELKTSFFDADRLMHQDVVVSAWFTEDIPYSYGPNYINGLPGIVLKYENVYYDYIASSVEFKEISVPILPKTISIFTPEEYREQWENGKDNFKN